MRHGGGRGWDGESAEEAPAVERSSTPHASPRERCARIHTRSQRPPPPQADTRPSRHERRHARPLLVVAARTPPPPGGGGGHGGRRGERGGGGQRRMEGAGGLAAVAWRVTDEPRHRHNGYGGRGAGRDGRRCSPGRRRPPRGRCPATRQGRPAAAPWNPALPSRRCPAGRPIPLPGRRHRRGRPAVRRQPRPAHPPPLRGSICPPRRCGRLRERGGHAAGRRDAGDTPGRHPRATARGETRMPPSRAPQQHPATASWRRARPRVPARLPRCHQRRYPGPALAAGRCRARAPCGGRAATYRARPASRARTIHRGGCRGAYQSGRRSHARRQQEQSRSRRATGAGGSSKRRERCARP